MQLLDQLEEDFPTNSVIQDFINMIKSPGLACISGGSVLEYRLHEKNLSNDIDIFVNDRFLENKEIVSNFFTTKNLDTYVNPVIRKLNNVKEKDLPFGATSQSILTQLSVENGGYDVFKGNSPYVIKSFRVFLESDIDLNFIFISDHIESKDIRFSGSSAYTIPRSGNLDLYKNTMPFLPKYIDDTFDFLELKYIFDFKTKTAKTVYEIQSQMAERIDKISVAGNLSQIKDILLRKQQHFMEHFNDPHIMTISNQSLIGDIFGSFEETPRNPITLTNIQYSNFEILEFSGMLYGLLGRVEKYKNRGFKINDPHGIITQGIHQHLLLSFGMLNLPHLEDIKREVVFQKNHSRLMDYKTISYVRDASKEIMEKIGQENAGFGGHRFQGFSPFKF